MFQNFLVILSSVIPWLTLSKWKNTVWGNALVSFILIQKLETFEYFTHKQNHQFLSVNIIMSFVLLQWFSWFLIPSHVKVIKWMYIPVYYNYTFDTMTCLLICIHILSTEDLLPLMRKKAGFSEKVPLALYEVSDESILPFLHQFYFTVLSQANVHEVLQLWR